MVPLWFIYPLIYPIIQIIFLYWFNVGIDSEVEILLTPGIKKWRKRITKGGRVTVSRNLADHSKSSLYTLLVDMGQCGLRRIANEHFHCKHCIEYYPNKKLRLGFDQSGNLACFYHSDTVFMSNKRISEIAFGVKKTSHTGSVTKRNLHSGKKKKQHSVSGHWRVLESGKRVWVKAHDRGRPRW